MHGDTLLLAILTCISENFLRSIWNLSRSSSVSPDSHTAIIGIFTDAKLSKRQQPRGKTHIVKPMKVFKVSFFIPASRNRTALFTYIQPLWSSKRNERWYILRLNSTRKRTARHKANTYGKSLVSFPRKYHPYFFYRCHCFGQSVCLLFCVESATSEHRCRKVPVAAEDGLRWHDPIGHKLEVVFLQELSEQNALRFVCRKREERVAGGGEIIQICFGQSLCHRLPEFEPSPTRALCGIWPGMASVSQQ